MKRYKIAAVLQIIHGGFMEIGGAVFLIPIFLCGNDIFKAGEYFYFIVPFFQDHLYLMLFAGIIYGIIRITGAVGLLKNRMWGFALSVMNCIVTLGVMMFMLPIGILDGIFAGGALIFMLTEYFGKRRIVKFDNSFHL